ncbi:NAD-dependent protein deacylase [Pedobacter yulinensis]|uniref:NAD-dependent protein deacylase n=1 Tax=Pedobacter yulinensis TaxID=2126353 RepID=A0A2T3HKQ9_9SPHI|nr:Sir2 family NAD-dependent protein deacetylase [Pedobacter yulinensis]PST82993.1 NAD-dependent protein deacylase [Pedobacter yulinensis]
MKKLVVLTGAGISAESGLKTFRDSDGLWEGHRVEEVATPAAWLQDPEKVQRFYNERREQVRQAEPNQAHSLLAALQEYFEVHIITQNVDDLHERAGSRNVLHLHGLITIARSTCNPDLLYPVGPEGISMGNLCSLGSQLRPHIVWFGEQVPMIVPAAELCSRADIFAVIGTSLAVYPAAGLIDYVPAKVRKYIIDPNIPDVRSVSNLHKIREKAVAGMRLFFDLLLKQHGEN